MKDVKKTKRKKRTPKDFEALEALCGLYRDARADVAERVRLLRARQRKYTRRLIPGLRARVSAQALAGKEIREHLLAHRERFRRPRTRVLAGIRVGWRKRPGRLVIPDPVRTVELIREKLSEDRQKALLVVTTRIAKPALRTLSAAEMASVGVSLVAVADEPVITVPGDGLDRTVSALLADHEEGEA